MEKTWQQRLEFGRKSFVCSFVVLLLTLGVFQYGVQDPLLRREVGFVFILSLVILAMSIPMWTWASYYTRRGRALEWIFSRLSIVLSLFFLIGVAMLFGYVPTPSPPDGWSLSPGAIITIASVIGSIALYIAGRIDALFHPRQGGMVS